ncbi:MAG: hypothetical protein MPK62_01960 [Alphaproteobacteria bacterium]|nr:hypothetical protein [Alphaproteobacteria bacterium]MDA8029898.1 hypothetical protein [Alphaproteobacteria bacterium]
MTNPVYLVGHTRDPGFKVGMQGMRPKPKPGWGVWSLYGDLLGLEKGENGRRLVFETLDEAIKVADAMSDAYYGGRMR